MDTLRITLKTTSGAVLLLFAASSLAQIKPGAAIPFPVNQPTSLPQPAAFAASSVPQVHTAQVRYAAGRLSVDADNSSLNQILHDISLQTGIKITGSVADDRVFGSYGPADPARILATLLDGSGSNMLLRQGDAHTGGELILTPRAGGISPPTPANTYGQMTGEDSPDTPAQRQRRFGMVPNINGEPQGPPNGAPPIPPQPAAPAAPGDAAATTPTFPADTTQQQSPNGVKTPQQIYDQLIKLQQQAAQQQRQANPQ